MNLHFTFRQMLAWAFVIIVVISATNIAVEARSYSMLYSSLSQLQFTLSNLSLKNDTVIGPNISVQVDGYNPIDFAGLEASKITFGTYFVSGNSTLFQQDPIAQFFTINQPLGAKSSTIWTITVRIVASQADQISYFRNLHLGPIIAPTTSVVVVSSSFLDRTGNPPQYLIRQNLTLT
jgi:hypothetical protein